MAGPNPTETKSLSRRDFLKLSGAGALVLSGIPSALEVILKPSSYDSEISISPLQHLMDALDRNDPQVVAEMIKAMKIIPESTVRYHLYNDESGNDNWNFSFVSQRPDLLLHREERYKYAWSHFHEPPLAQVSLNSLNLNREQSNSLYALLGGKKEDNLVADVTSVGVVLGGAVLAVSGVKDIAKGKVGRGLAETGLGLSVAATGVVSNEKLYKSLPPLVQDSILTVAKLMSLNYLAACNEANTSDVPNLSPIQTGEAGSGSISPTPTQVLSAESTPIPTRVPTSLPEPPGKDVPYPDSASGFKWAETRYGSNVMDELERNGSIYFETTNSIESFYNQVAEGLGLNKDNIDFVGSVGPDTWVIAMKHQGKFYTLKQKDGLLISEITPFNIYNQDPSNFPLVEIDTPSGYFHDDLRLVQDISTYHLFATKDQQFYLDLTMDEWIPVNANVEIIPTESSFNFEVGQWAEKEDGSLNAEKMFFLVGAINKKHHRMVDLSYDDMRIAVVIGEEMTEKDAESYDDSKNEQANQLNSNTDLKSKLDQVNIQIDKNKLPNYTIVVENEKIKWVVDQRDDIPVYLELSENGELVQLDKEREPQLLPELRINGPFIERTDTGEKVQFVGVGLASHERSSEESIFDYIKKNVEKNEAVGIYSNVYLDQFDVTQDTDKLEEFEKTARYLESRGMYFIVNPSDWKNIESWAFPTEKTEDALNKLAERLINPNNVIFNLYNEIGVLPNGLSPESSDWTPWIIRLHKAIIQPYIDKGKQQPWVLVGGLNWSRDFRNYNIPIEIGKWAANVHEYKVWDYEGGPLYEARYMWEFMIGEVPVFITENGALDATPFEESEDIPFVEDTLSIAAQYPQQVHYLGWNGGHDGGDGLRSAHGGISKKGAALANSELMEKRTDFRK